jgi:hypothetical protein
MLRRSIERQDENEMPKSLAVRFLLCCAGLLSCAGVLACTGGCSCSSHIPESPPGDGPVGEIRNVQTGQVIQATPGTPNPYGTPTNSQPTAANANRPPLPGKPAPVKAKTTADTLP